MALSKNKIKYIRSLKEKKFRTEYGTFVAEGNKMVNELINYMECQLLIATKEFLADVDIKNIQEVIVATGDEISQASFLKTPQQAIGIFLQPKHQLEYDLNKDLCIALDGVQDPGNMGTIIRLADWYGIKHIFCSLDTVDIYNPKVVQATMGALARVNIHYLNLIDFLKDNNQYPIYGTLLDGENMYEKEITSNGIIVMGNEGNGIRPEIEKLIKNKLYIPNYPIGQLTSESLNVAIATAIICAEFRRRN